METFNLLFTNLLQHLQSISHFSVTESTADNHHSFYHYLKCVDHTFSEFLLKMSPLHLSIFLPGKGLYKVYVDLQADARIQKKDVF